MQIQTAAPMFQSERKPSRQMRAILMIFLADPHLMMAVSPYIDRTNESIRWDKILKLPLGSGHKGAIAWAYGVWTDEKPKANCFGSALNMSAHLQRAVIGALALRWGI